MRRGPTALAPSPLAGAGGGEVVECRAEGHEHWLPLPLRERGGVRGRKARFRPSVP